MLKHSTQAYYACYVNYPNLEDGHHMVVVHSGQLVKRVSVPDALPMEIETLNWLIKGHNLNCGS